MYIGGNIVRDGLVLHLDAGSERSYPKSGTVWKDLSGNGNNGTLTNGPTFDSGNGGSITFDGVNDYVLFGGTTRYFTSYITQQITIETWLYVPSSANWSNGFYGNIIARGNYNGSHGLFRTTINNQISAWFRQDDNIISPLIVQSTGNMERDKWTHVVGIWKSPGSALYINGQISSENNTSFGDTNASAEDTNWWIGLNSAASGADGNYFNGKQTLTKIYNRALSPQEIQQNFNATKTRFGL
jgi:hypothetical protein